MSKKMSLADMKEVKKLIGMLITNGFKDKKFLQERTYRNTTTSFYTDLSSSSMINYVESLVDKNSITKEISDLQKKVVEKQKELLKSVCNATKTEITENLSRDDERRWGISDSFFDGFNAIQSTSNSIRNIIFKRLKNNVDTFVSKLNKYITDTEAKVFDAYTKGMSADDFLDIVKEELKSLTLESEEIIKEIEESGYDITD